MIPPVDGERVLFCEHCDVSEFHISVKAPHHWWHLGESNEVTDKRTGDTFKVKWLCLCDLCHKSIPHNEECTKFASKDAPWIGSPPDITRYI